MKSGAPRIDLEEARRRLRELGYLQSPVERFFFRRAIEGRAPVLLPAILLAAVGASLASVAAVAAGEGALRDHAPSALVLWAHLAAADLLPCVVLGSILGALAGRSRSPTAGAVAAGLASAAAVFGLFAAGVYSLTGRLSASSLLWGAPAAAAALLLGASVRSAFLARAYARSGALPGGRGGRAGAVGILLLLLAGVALLLPDRTAPAQPPPPLPSPREDPLVVVAADGLLFDETDRGAASGRLGSMLARGAVGWWPARRGSPPEIWMDVATGLPADRHGVRALARVRPAGSPGGVRPPLGARWYLRGIGPRLGLVESEPVSAADRRRLAFWEVAASAGLSSAAIGWWASGPWPGATVLDNF